MENILTENVYNVNPTKATIMALDGPYKNKTVEVMFNPSEYNIVYSADVSGPETTGAKKETTEEKDPFFEKVKLEDFTIKLIFDTYEYPQGSQDVRKKAEEITRLIIPKTEGATKKKPPVCLFKWKDFEYKGIITKIDQKFILFLPNGTPVREEMTLIFKSILSQEEIEKNTGYEACRKAWIVKSGDRLDLIAAFELKDASLWRKIANENEIDDPLTFPRDDDIGRIIIIPD